jgi:hypothetical protein
MCSRSYHSCGDQRTSQEPGAFNVTSGSTTSLTDAARRFYRALGSVG